MARFSIQAVTIITGNTDVYLLEPVTVTELKTYLQIEGSAYDGPLGIFITAARQMIEDYANVSLVGKVIRAQIANPIASNAFPLPYPPIESVESLAWRKCRTQNIILDNPGEWSIYDEYSGAVTIQADKSGVFFANYTTEPDTRTIWAQAIKAQAGYMFNNRDSNEAITTMAPEALVLVNQFRNNYF